MAGSTFHIGYLKQPIPENIQCRNITEETKSTYDNIKSVQNQIIDKFHTKDTYEKTLETIESMYGCYSDNGTMKGVTGGVLDYHFVWDIQENISDCMQKFYEGKIDEEGLEDYFGLYCSFMRIYRTQQSQTSGKNEDDNRMTLNDIYNMFLKENMRVARNANYYEGEKINSSYGGATDDWVYYNADYYYKCEETREKLREIAEKMSIKWEVPSFDVYEVEKNPKYTIDGGLDFNSGWNFSFRNQRGRGSIAKEAMVPSKGFKMFYKESARSKERSEDVDSIGILKISIGKDDYTREVLFKKLRTGLEGEIFDVGILIKDCLSKKDDHAGLIELLSNFSIFTRGYSFKSRITDRAGDYIPLELRK